MDVQSARFFWVWTHALVHSAKKLNFLRQSKSRRLCNKFDVLLTSIMCHVHSHHIRLTSRVLTVNYLVFVNEINYFRKR